MSEKAPGNKSESLVELLFELPFKLAKWLLGKI
jgi:hypothetical protein